MPIDDTQHGRHQTNGKDIVGVGEETDAGDDDSSNMVPAEGRFVDFGERKSSALVGVSDMSIVVVEVMEGSIPACCPLSHSEAKGCCRRLPRMDARNRARTKGNKSTNRMRAYIYFGSIQLCAASIHGGRLLYRLHQDANRSSVRAHFRAARIEARSLRRSTTSHRDGGATQQADGVHRRGRPIAIDPAARAGNIDAITDCRTWPVRATTSQRAPGSILLSLPEGARLDRARATVDRFRQ